MSQQDILALAKQGDPQAIAILLNRSTQPHGITVKAARQHQDLFLLIEAVRVPEEANMVALVRQAMVKLEVESVRTVKIFGRQTGNKTALWNQDLKLPLLEPLREAETPSVAPADAIADTDANLPELVEHDAVDTLDLASNSDLDTPLTDAAEVTPSPDDRDEFEAAFDTELNTTESTLPELATDEPEVSSETALDEFEAALDAEPDTPESPLAELTTTDPEAALETAIDEFEAALEAVTEEAEVELETELETSDEPVPVEASPVEDSSPLADSDGALFDGMEAIAPDETLEPLDAPFDVTDPTLIDPLESDPLGAVDEVMAPSENQFPGIPGSSLDLEAALETIGPDETAIYIEGPDPKPDPESSDERPSDQLPATPEPEPAPSTTPDCWTDSLAPSQSISEPESIHPWPDQLIATPSVETPDPNPESAPDPSAPVPEALAPELSPEESEVQILLQKPEALAVLLVVLLVTLWDAYFQVLDEAEMTDGALSGRALSRRLGTSASTVRRRREQADFSVWTQGLDPDGIAWIYREDGKFVPRL